MKYIKLFEENEEIEPQVGNYVVCELKLVSRDPYVDYNELIKNNIGIIEDIDEDEDNDDDDFIYQIKFDTFKPANFVADTFNLRKSEIKFFSDKKEDCEVYLNAKKYNL